MVSGAVAATGLGLTLTWDVLKPYENPVYIDKTQVINFNMGCIETHLEVSVIPIHPD